MSDEVQKIGYDELLHARVRQLKEIEDRLQEIQNRLYVPRAAAILTNGLIIEVRHMVQEAEAEHAAF